jgi:hypothetical protein
MNELETAQATCSAPRKNSTRCFRDVKQHKNNHNNEKEERT